MISAVLLAVCLLPQGPQAGKVRVKPAERLEAIGLELSAAVVQRRPWLATERGIARGQGQRIGRYGPAATKWWHESIEGLEARMEQVLPRTLSPEDLALYQALSGWLEMELVLNLARTPERWDAASYVERAERSLLLLFHADWLSTEERWMEIGRILAEMPTYWTNAEHGLVAPIGEYSDEAIQRLVDLENFMEIDLRIELEQIGADPRSEEFEKRLNSAVQRTREFRQWLLRTPASLGGSVTVIGARNWESVVRAVSGTDLSIGRIKTSLLREIAALERERGPDWRARPATEDELDSEHIAAGVQAASTRAMRVALSAELLQEDKPARLRIHPTVARGPATLGPMPLFVGSKTSQSILFEPESSNWSPEVAATRTSFFTTEALICHGVRFGFPGESLLRKRTQETDDPVQEFLVNRSVLEGWGLYCLDWMLRVDWVDNPFHENEDFRAEAVRARILEAIRLLAALEIHAEGLSPSEAAENFRRRAGIDIETAKLEVRHAQRDPLVGIGYLGYLELQRLEQDLARVVDSRTALKQTIRTALAHPYLRPQEMRLTVARPGSR